MNGKVIAGIVLVMGGLIVSGRTTKRADTKTVTVKGLLEDINMTEGILGSINQCIEENTVKINADEQLLNRWNYYFIKPSREIFEYAYHYGKPKINLKYVNGFYNYSPFIILMPLMMRKHLEKRGISWAKLSQYERNSLPANNFYKELTTSKNNYFDENWFHHLYMKVKSSLPLPPTPTKQQAIDFADKGATEFLAFCKGNLNEAFRVTQYEEYMGDYYWCRWAWNYLASLSENEQLDILMGVLENNNSIHLLRWNAGGLLNNSLAWIDDQMGLHKFLEREDFSESENATPVNTACRLLIISAFASMRAIMDVLPGGLNYVNGSPIGSSDDYFSYDALNKQWNKIKYSVMDELAYNKRAQIKAIMYK